MSRPPLTPAQEKTEKDKQKNMADWKRNSFSEAYKKDIDTKNTRDQALNDQRSGLFKQDPALRVTNFIKLDKTIEEIKKEKEEQEQVSAGIIAEGNKLYTPGYYTTEPESFYHILCEENGTPPRRTAKPLFGSDKDIFQETNYMKIREAYGAAIDFMVLSSQSRRITLDWDTPEDVNKFHLRNAMYAALDRGVKFEFGKNTRIAMNGWSKKERERFFKFQEGINLHAEKYQAFLGIGEDMYSKAKEELDKQAKLDTDDAKAREELFGKESDFASKESIDSVDTQLKNATERLEKVKEMSQELVDKINSTDKLLDKPDAFETEIVAPKEDGVTGVQMLAITAFNFTLPMLALPYHIAKSFMSKTEEAKAGKMNSKTYLDKINSKWGDSEAKRSELIESMGRELEDLTRMQALLEEEIHRLSQLKLTRDDLPEIQKQIDALNLGEKDPDIREELEAQLEELKNQQDIMESQARAAHESFDAIKNKKAEITEKNNTLTAQEAGIADVSRKLEAAKLGKDPAVITPLKNKLAELQEQHKELKAEHNTAKQELVELEKKTPKGIKDGIAEIKKKLGVRNEAKRADLEKKEKVLLAKKEAASMSPEQKTKDREKMAELKNKSKELQKTINEQKKLLNDVKEAVKNMPDKITEKIKENEVKLSNGPGNP